jgi:hypothetical protein
MFKWIRVPNKDVVVLIYEQRIVTLCGVRYLLAVMQRGDLLSLRSKTVYYLASAAGFGAIPKRSASLTIADPEASLQVNPGRIQTTPEYNDESVGRTRGSLSVSCENQRLISCIFSRINFIQSCAGELKSFPVVKFTALIFAVYIILLF